LACLDLAELPEREGWAGKTFEGRNLHLEYHRLFGGQLIAQFARAAALTCPGKAVKSLHVLFPREGAASEPVRYEAERHHEGGTFATLAVTARQETRGVIATASVSMHAIEDGRVLQTVAPVTDTPGAARDAHLALLPFEARSAISLEAAAAAPP